MSKRAVSAIPKFPLQKTTELAQTLEDKNGGIALPPVEAALALELSPRNSGFEQMDSASIKYGLTTGNSRSDNIALIPLGQRIVTPTTPDHRAESLLLAALSPDTFRRM